MKNQVTNPQKRVQDLLKLRNMILEIVTNTDFVDDELAERLIEVAVRVNQAHSEALDEYLNK